MHTRIILFGNTSEPIGTLRTPGFLQKWLEPQFPADFEARALYNVLVCQLDHLEHKMCVTTGREREREIRLEALWCTIYY